MTKKVLLVGETWLSSATHIKGFDHFGSVTFHSGADPLTKALAGSDFELIHLPAHEAVERLPFDIAGLEPYDAILLSDIGANSLLLLLDGGIALITGGTRGLGLAIGERFAASGAARILLDLPSQKSDASLPPRFQFAAGDVTDEASLQEAVEATVKSYGRLDIVVANAGIVPPWRDTEGLDMEEWDRVMAVNVRGIAATLKHATPALKQSGGSVVAMASINAYSAHPRQMLYTASKHAVLGIVRAAARDLGRYGVRVNAVAPGPIATAALIEPIRFRARNGPSEEEALAALAAETPLGRLATADEVAKAVLFLASDLSSGISGELLPVAA